MRREHRIIKTVVLLVADIVCCLASYWLSLLIRFQGISDTTNISVLFVAMSYFVIIDLFGDHYNSFFKRNNSTEFITALLDNFYIFLFVLFISFATQNTGVLSRMTVFLFILFNIILQFAARTAVKYLARKYYSVSDAATKVLILAEKNNISTILKRFDAGTGHKVIGTLAVENGRVSGTVYNHTIKAEMSSLTSALVQFSFDEVLMILPDYELNDLKELILNFEDMGVVCRYGVDLPDVTNGRLSIYGGYPVITWRASRPDPMALLVKRIFDIIGGCIGLVICGVIWLFLTPAIKLDSPGPIFFSQIRIGKNGRRFRFYKFRSMYVDAEEHKKDLMDKNEMNGLMFKIEDDPRITKVGRFIRRTSLDEWPQFWNVLIGDMSLVGTRPPTEEEFEKYNEHYRRRLSMTPGITGLWQVSGRSDIKNFDDVVKLDLEYIDNWSLKLDLQILLRTIGVLARHKGAE